jgi:hypothetical protein
MHVASKACVLLLFASLLGCSGNSQAEKLVVENLRLLDDYAEAMEAIGTVPNASKARELKERITKIEAAILANNDALKAFSLNELKAVGDRHREEADRVQERLKHALKIYRAKMPNLKKSP